MTVPTYDVLVLGSGFGGSLLSAMLAKSGLSVALVDCGRHPRFAIGESSTPLADSVLAKIATEYDLPELLPLTRYGTWTRTHPKLTCGLKRGFSYFGHQPCREFQQIDQLIVAASGSDEHSDTHWLRSDVDHFLFQLAVKTGVETVEDASYQLDAFDSGWRVTGTKGSDDFALQAEAVVDATGPSGIVLRTLGIADQTEVLKTQSWAIYAHFESVRPVADVLDELNISRQRHPFLCDAAAVHHVLDDGWMWQLPFDDGTVSCGRMIANPSGAPKSTTEPAQQTWDRTLSDYAFLNRQFAGAKQVRPFGGLQSTDRLQRLTTQAAGDNWVVLPSTAGFIDPLHSTGIAHTLFGIERIAEALTGSRQLRRDRLRHYSRSVIDELRFIDELVEGCYASLPCFRLWSAWCMLYFAAATSVERMNGTASEKSFLGANQTDFRRMLRGARRELDSAISGPQDEEKLDAFEDFLRDTLRPWNDVGLLNPGTGGMYSETAAPVRES